MNYLLELLRISLWNEGELSGLPTEEEWNEMLETAKKQTLVGLLFCGIDILPQEQRPPKKLLLQWIGLTQITEQRNEALNRYLAKLVRKLRKENITVVLVKGQGVAQCYESPLRRESGDIDFLVDEDNYRLGKELLTKHAQKVHEENTFDKHFSVDMKGCIVELHGSMRSMLPKRADNMIDEVQEDTLKNGKTRIWLNNEVEIALPSPDNDVIFVFTHILKHFFHYGIGLRQVCDWCRLLWTYKESIDKELLEERLNKMGLMSEWKAFGALAVDKLGMPADAMPFYSSEKSWKRKADRILSFIIKTGNFGHNRDTSYQHKYTFIVRKAISFKRHIGDSLSHFLIFPKDSVKIFGRLICEGLFH